MAKNFAWMASIGRQSGWAAARVIAEALKVNDRQPRLSLFQILGSVLSSFFGVQNNETRERDFKHGRARDFIIVGAILTVVFILVVFGVVQLVMRLAVPGQ